VKGVTPEGILKKVFYLLMGWFPCQFAFSLAWGKVLEVQADFVFLGALYSLFAFGAALRLGFPKGGLTAGSGARLLPFLCLAAALVRIWVILVLQNPPLSNYWEAHESAVLLLSEGTSILHPRPETELTPGSLALYHTVYPCWALYMLVLKNVYGVFGASILVGQYLNVFLCVAVMIICYAIGVKCLKSPGTGLAAAGIFGFWPAGIFYSVLHSPDYCILLLTGIFLLLWHWSESRRENTKWWARLLRLIPVGVTLGVLDRFKSIALIFLTALLIYEGVCHVLPALWERIRGRGKQVLRALGSGAVTVGTVAVAMTLSTAGVDAAIARNIGHAPENLTGWFFYVGLTGDGMWNPWKQTVQEQLLEENNYDVAAVSRELMDIALERVDSHTRDTWKMIQEKTQTFWADDLDLYRCMYGHTAEHLYFTIKGSARVYYMALLLFALIGAAGLLLSPFGREREERTLFLAGLMLFGCALMFLVSEMQIRYKFILGVPLSLLAAHGAACLPRLAASAKRAVLALRKRAGREAPPLPAEASDAREKT